MLTKENETYGDSKACLLNMTHQKYWVRLFNVFAVRLQVRPKAVGYVPEVSKRRKHQQTDHVLGENLRKSKTVFFLDFGKMWEIKFNIISNLGKML